MQINRYKKVLNSFVSGFLILGISGCAMEPPRTPADGHIWVKLCKQEYNVEAKQKEGEDAELAVGFKVTCDWKEVPKNQQNNNSLISFGFDEWFVQWQLLSDMLDGKSPWAVPSFGQMKTSPSNNGLAIKFRGQNYAIPYKQGNARIRFYRNGHEVNVGSSSYIADQNGLYLTNQSIKNEILGHMELADSVSVSLELDNVPFKIIDNTPGTLVSVTAAVTDGQKLLTAATGSFVTSAPTLCRFYCDEP
ncbi:hypothetical protein [Permianibacter aggregans]|uniref:Lipoprotein n=1 Tax=Permianibacter aggregans TaxID=1510150 RepID=A0A4R6UL14_9GAMM|nr:hypothetical protein [Permianibacter aggregans]QGX39102.1 hypothetical protein E2H98_05255 [Permianibacter aggregans]TDQ47690.1 hypothetical protein EV696_10994 [Permianibacter aggregans]